MDSTSELSIFSSCVDTTGQSTAEEFFTAVDRPDVKWSPLSTELSGGRLPACTKHVCRTNLVAISGHAYVRPIQLD